MLTAGFPTPRLIFKDFCSYLQLVDHVTGSVSMLGRLGLRKRQEFALRIHALKTKMCIGPQYLNKVSTLSLCHNITFNIYKVHSKLNTIQCKCEHSCPFSNSEGCLIFFFFPNNNTFSGLSNMHCIK